MNPQSMEFSGQDAFFVEATCPKPENGDMVFAGWYKDAACTDGPVTYLSIYNDLKDEPYGAAPYAPIDSMPSGSLKALRAVQPLRI